MKLNKKMFSAITAFGLIALATTVIGVNNNVVFSNAETETYTITFSNEKNKIESYFFNEYIHFKTDLGNDVEVYVSEIEAYENGWATLYSYANFIIEDTVKNITSVTITTDSENASISLGAGATYDDAVFLPMTKNGNVYSSEYVTPVNYIEMDLLSNIMDVNIREMIITFNC